MDDQTFADSAARILHVMSLERTGWRSFFQRWFVSHEPLRNDAANLLRDYGYEDKRPNNTRRIGDN